MNYVGEDEENYKIVETAWWIKFGPAMCTDVKMTSHSLFGRLSRFLYDRICSWCLTLCSRVWFLCFIKSGKVARERQAAQRRVLLSPEDSVPVQFQLERYTADMHALKQMNQDSFIAMLKRYSTGFARSAPLPTLGQTHSVR
jgi:hypothetical protein